MIRAIKLEWIQLPSGMRVPKDEELYKLADRFAKEQLARPLDLPLAPHSWVVVRTEEDVPVEVLSVGGLQFVPDAFMFRTKPGQHAAKATKKLWDRMNDFLADNGYRGQEAMLFISSEETEEQKCPKWKEWLSRAGARLADRFLVKVK